MRGSKGLRFVALLMAFFLLLHRLIPVAESGIICLIPVVSPVSLPVCTACSPLSRLVIRGSPCLVCSLSGLPVRSSKGRAFPAVPVHAGPLLPPAVILSKILLVLISVVGRPPPGLPAAVFPPALPHAPGDLPGRVLHASGNPVRRAVDSIRNCLVQSAEVSGIHRILYIPADFFPESFPLPVIHPVLPLTASIF